MLNEAETPDRSWCTKEQRTPYLWEMGTVESIYHSGRVNLTPGCVVGHVEGHRLAPGIHNTCALERGHGTVWSPLRALFRWAVWAPTRAGPSAADVI